MILVKFDTKFADTFNNIDTSSIVPETISYSDNATVVDEINIYFLSQNN